MIYSDLRKLTYGNLPEMILNRRLRRSGLWQENSRRTTGALEHAQSVWSRSRLVTAGNDMARIGWLAGHVVGCRTCSMVWIEGDRPADYLEKWIRRSSMRDIWRAVA